MSRVLVDSGVSWLGKIPDSWSTCRVKNKFLFHKIIAKEKSVNYDRIALTLNGVIKRDKDDSNGLQPDNYNGYQVVYKDDFDNYIIKDYLYHYISITYIVINEDLINYKI